MRGKDRKGSGCSIDSEEVALSECVRVAMLQRVSYGFTEDYFRCCEVLLSMFSCFHTSVRRNRSLLFWSGREVHGSGLRLQTSEGTVWKNVPTESSLITFQVCLVGFAAMCQGDACGSLVLLGLDLVDVEEASDKAQENIRGIKSRNLTTSRHLYSLV